MAQRLLDFSQPFDVGLLDATVQAVYRPGFSQEGSEAEKVLRALQEHPDTWMQVVNILSNSKSIDSKYFALQVLESVVKYRWNALPVDQRDGIKNFISELIVRLSTNEATFRSERVYLNKLNIVLVQVLKHDWPHRWPTFLSDLVGAAKTSETVCENCMVILKLLSEEIFDFSRGEMTQSKIKELKSSLNKEFQLINELCQYVLACSNRPPLIRATLATLHAFLSWIPLAYIFESPLIEVLLKLFPTPHYRNLSVQCLTEIASLTIEGPYDAQYMNMLVVFLTNLQTLIPVNSNMASAYDQGSDDDQAFIQNVGLFLTSFLKNHLPLLENNQQNHPYLLMALSFLIQISYVSDIEVFKSCLDYWHHLVSYLFQKECSMENSAQNSPSGLQVGIVGMGQTMSDGIGQVSPRKLLYHGHLSQIRTLMITRMAKPEEVIVVEDENGNVVRETLKDNDVLAQYKIMRETLIYLSHLDYDDTERQMTTRLENQSNNHEFIWNDLNTLCWAIGSISGSMIEEQENRFLVTVIRELLNLCEITRGKNNKAIIASNIMYVVGQYPRFLKAHWKFLKTVVNKLFEFMHESHPGVQDMACDTFLKIVQKTRRKFVIHQLGEVEPFICELLRGLSSTILDLQPSQIHTFYEAVGYMISAEIEASRRDEYLHKLMQLPNDRWSEIIKQAHVNSDSLKDREVIKNVLNILQTNTSVASSLGHPFLSQLSAIFLDMLNVYKMYSEIISKLISEGGPYAARSTDVKLLRSVKREVLKLIETFMERSDDNELIANQFVPAMTDPILGDYARNVPDARESEVLSLFAAIIDKLKGLMLDKVPSIFEAVFECTLQMITKNMEDYPDHRLKFFSLLRAIAAHCFSALFALNSAHLKVMMDSVFWAIRHTERNIAEIGLNLLLEMLNNFQTSPFCNQFHRAYFMNIEREIFIVMTDTFHKPGFKLHALILHHLFCLLNSGSLTEPLWDVSTLGLSAYPSNEDFVGTETVNLLATSFPNISAVEVNAFVKGLFASRDDIQVFKNHLRDFLVQTKEFSDKDNKELYADENAAQQERQRQQMMQVPGLIPPSSLPYDNRMEG